LLDLVDEAFNQMSFTIQVPIIFALYKAILFRRNHYFDAFGGHGFNQSVRVVTFIRNQYLRLEVFNQHRCLWAVMALACREQQAQRIAQSIHGDVNLGGKAAATSA
jgi:hypothetical protein